MDLRREWLGFPAIALMACSCGSTANGGGGGGVYIATDASGDSSVADGKSSDVKAGDTASSDTSATDGGVTEAQIMQCWQDKCGSNVSACQANATCATALACMLACPKTDSVCPNNCANPLQGDLTALGAFANLANCTKANCDLTNLPANTCGNGKCEGDESSWCSMDCDTTISALAGCATGKCSADACILDTACDQALNCVLECSDPSCWSGCTPTSTTSANLYQPVWDCVQTDCGNDLPQGSP